MCVGTGAVVAAMSGVEVFQCDALKPMFGKCEMAAILTIDWYINCSKNAESVKIAGIDNTYSPGALSWSDVGLPGRPFHVVAGEAFARKVNKS